MALLRFRVGAGDRNLLRNFHKSNSARGQMVTYLSPAIQNELTECCGEYIRRKIVDDVRDAPFFTFCADEAADTSNQEQLPLVVKYVDSNGLIYEDLLDFLLCDDGVSGQALANLPNHNQATSTWTQPCI